MSATDGSDTTRGLIDLGWSDVWAAAMAGAPAAGVSAGSRPARVVRTERSALIVDDGNQTLTVSGGVNAVGATTGDWIVLDPEDTVATLLPRLACVRRAEASGRSTEQVLAANIDVVALVVSLALEPDLGRLERLVSLAWTSGATPLVILTKADLVEDASEVAADVSTAAPGIDVLVVSGTTGEGLDEIRSRLGRGRTLVLLGQSGVGKSTLVNALAGAEIVETGQVGVTGKGRHVTSTRDLILLGSDGVLLDTPGLRGVGLVGGDEGLEGVEATFPEIEALAGHCRFGDCQHVSEPGCAVLSAVESGELLPRRVESWRKLLRESAWMARRGDARLMAEERKKWKQVHMSVRRSGTTRR